MEDTTSTIGSIRSSASIRAPEHARESSVTLLPDAQLVISHGQGRHITKATILQDLAEKQFPLEDSELIVKTLEKSIDVEDRASFFDGIRMRDVVDGAIEPTIAIVFMPGADVMSVNQQEQIGMTQDEPDQKDPRWRINTAGTLLRNFEVANDMSITQTDYTQHVVANTRKRRAMENGPFTLSSSNSVAIRPREDRTVTIDSANVKIVRDLPAAGSDLEATLIEVDQSSLFSLIINYRQIIHHDGPATTVESTLKLLDVMIEDARRLCIRSPILFRMSTRQRIIRSRNTRYGVDHGTMFQTITTSGGIKNIISRSAAYYNSLPIPGDEDVPQKMIRPKFLQMLVLLLSLLNDSDLKDIAAFLETTYNLKADRFHIELLILKVVPLMSINSKIFLREMVNAVEQTQYPHFPKEDYQTWNIFIERLIPQGFILPGTAGQMGQLDRSWIVKWPADGFKDSHVFNNLQYAGKARTFNEIPPFNLNLNKDDTEIRIVLTNGQKYLIDYRDHEQITRMNAGRFSVTEFAQERRTFDLDVTEAVVNDHLSTAIQKVNNMLSILNGYFAVPKQKKVLARIGSLTNMTGREEATIFPDIRGCGRLTYHQAQLGEDILAVAYKVEGKKISRRDLIRNLNADIRKVLSTIQVVEAQMIKYTGKRLPDDVRRTITTLHQGLPAIQQLIGYAEQQKRQMESLSLDLSDEPISQTISPGGLTENHKSSIYWSDYTVRFNNLDGGCLRVEALRYIVRRVVWTIDGTAEIQLAGLPARYLLAPLRRIKPDEREYEVKPEDRIMLVGQYVAVLEPEEDDFTGVGVAVSTSATFNPHHANANGGLPGPSNGYGNANGNGNPNASHISFEHGTDHSRRPVEIIVNWLRVVGIEQQALNPRRINRVRPGGIVESVFH